MFDPVHCGHLAVAHTARARLPVDEVVFLPSGLPPHKPQGAHTPAHHRMAMLERALAGESGLRIDARELHRAGPSYTVTTLGELHAEAPQRRCFFLIGADNIRALRHWVQAERILELCVPVVFPRPGHPTHFTPADLPFLPPARLAELDHWAAAMDMAAVAVSSSEIRRRAATGLDLDGLVPPAVADYIALHGLYRQP